MDFIPPKFLQDAIDSGDVFEVRISVGSFININPGDVDKIRAAKEYANQQVDGLMEEHDGEEFERNKEKWDEDYLAINQTKLMDNFSEERFNHILNIGVFMYPQKKKESNNSYNKQSKISENHRNTRPELSSYPLKWVVGGMILVGAIGMMLIFRNK